MDNPPPLPPPPDSGPFAFPPPPDTWPARLQPDRARLLPARLRRHHAQRLEHLPVRLANFPRCGADPEVHRLCDRATSPGRDLARAQPMGGAPTRPQSSVDGAPTLPPIALVSVALLLLVGDPGRARRSRGQRGRGQHRRLGLPWSTDHHSRRARDRLAQTARADRGWRCCYVAGGLRRGAARLTFGALLIVGGGAAVFLGLVVIVAGIGRSHLRARSLVAPGPGGRPRGGRARRRPVAFAGGSWPGQAGACWATSCSSHLISGADRSRRERPSRSRSCVLSPRIIDRCRRSARCFERRRRLCSLRRSRIGDAVPVLRPALQARRARTAAR